MMNQWWDVYSKAGVSGGLLVTLVVTADYSDIVATIILSVTGAISSLLVTMGLRWLVRWWKKKKRLTRR